MAAVDEYREWRMMMMMDSAAVTLRAQPRTPSSSSAGRMRRSIDPDVTTSRNRRTVVRSRCDSTSNDRPWPSATPLMEEDEPDEDVFMDEPGQRSPEVVHQRATTWDGFDQHIRCIATSDPREQFVKKRSTDKASDTYKAAMREINGSLERLYMSDSDEELAVAIGDASSRDPEVQARQTSVEASRKMHRKVKDVREHPESEVRTASAAGWRTESTSGMRSNQHHRLHQQQQQQQNLDENATKRAILYEKYLERQNVWAEGLTKSGKELLMAIQRRKKRSSRFPVSPSTDDFNRPTMVRSTTWCSTSNERSGLRAFSKATEKSLSCNG